ncbi:MAG: hypothetical protein GYA23_00525 [Methanomicrobiales archaeon]|nr:hypothetical protein [Methanomicrobiales archaeon]
MPWHAQIRDRYIMPGRKDTHAAFRHTTVLVRADIYDSARERGIDISDTCNQALAGILGIDYRQQRLDDVPPPAPVIVARDGAAPGTAAPPLPARSHAPQPPVINADDPKAPGTIATIRKERPRKTPPAETVAPHPAPVPHSPVAGGHVAHPAQPAPPVPANPAEPAAPALHEKSRAGKTTPAAGRKPAVKPAKKPAKRDIVKQFIAAKVVRDDSPEAFVAKEELYGLFSRFCREQKTTTVPDSKEVTVALKTRFAFREKTTEGTPGWANIRLR